MIALLIAILAIAFAWEGLPPASLGLRRPDLSTLIWALALTFVFVLLLGPLMMRLPGWVGLNSYDRTLADLAKRLELLHEVAPNAGRIGLLVNPSVPTDYDTKEGLDAARVLGLELRVFSTSDEHAMDAAFAAMAQWQTGGLLIAGGNYFTIQSRRLAALALAHKVPAIFNVRDFPAAGGLMSYGGDPVDAYRIVGNYVGRILKGEKPANLPIQQTTKVELIINMKTAKAFGLTVPLSLVGRADEVIE